MLSRLRPGTLLLSALALTASPFLLTQTQASLAGMQQQIRLAEERSPLESQIQSMVANSDVIHGMQQQVSDVTRTLDSYLQQHSHDSANGSPTTESISHAEIERLMTTVESLTKSQQEIEARQARQIEQDHQNLLELIETQKKQQEMLTQELAHSKSLEVELAELKAHEHHSPDSMHQSMENQIEDSQRLTQEIEQQQSRFQHAFEEEGDGSFLELGWDVNAFLESSAQTELGETEIPAAHAEHDIDLQHTMNHEGESEWERHEREQEEGGAHFLETDSQDRRDLDPSQYQSSADYLAAMNSADNAENMNPQQLQAFGERMGAPVEQHEVGTPSNNPAGLHSMSEIDSLMAAGAAESDNFEFHPNQLKTASLKNDLSMLQDEDSIQTAMLHAQAKIKAIAAELERHQAANGGDHSEGIEIDMEDIGADGSITL